MNSLELGSSSRAVCPFADTNLQSITPRNTIDIQNRTVFAVELEFTSTSPLFRAPRLFPLAAPDHFYLFRPSRFPASGFIDKPFSLRPIPLDAAKPYPTHKPLDAVRNPK